MSHNYFAQLIDLNDGFDNEVLKRHYITLLDPKTPQSSKILSAHILAAYVDDPAHKLRLEIAKENIKSSFIKNMLTKILNGEIKTSWQQASERSKQEDLESQTKAFVEDYKANNTKKAEVNSEFSTLAIYKKYTR